MSTATAQPNASIWDMEVPQPSTGEFTPIPAGTHPARIAAVLDVGHQPETRKDDKTGAVSNVEVRKIVLVYELVKKGPDGKPFTIADRYTWSMHEKASFFKMVCNITGQKFAAGQKFNPVSLIGKPVMVSVIHKDGKEQGKVHANVGGVSSYPDGFPDPTTTYESVFWSVKEGTPFPDRAWFPFVYGKTIKAIVTESSEARGFGGAVAPVSTPQSTPAVHDDDQPPF